MLRETFLAVDGFTCCWFEGDGGGFSAFRTFYFSTYSFGSLGHSFSSNVLQIIEKSSGYSAHNNATFGLNVCLMLSD